MKKIHQLCLNLAFTLALITSITALMSGIGARFELWQAATGFALLKYSALTALVALILSIVAIALALAAKQTIFNKRVACTLIIATVVAVAPYLYFMSLSNIPTLADVTTNIDNPPSFIDALPLRKGNNSGEYPGEEAAVLQKKYFPKLQGLITGYTKQQMITWAEQVVIEMGMEIISSDPELGRLEATTTSFWFGFKYDVVIRILPQPLGNTLLDVRSSSRERHLDGGANGKRIEAFFILLERKLP